MHYQTLSRDVELFETRVRRPLDRSMRAFPRSFESHFNRCRSSHGAAATTDTSAINEAYLNFFFPVSNHFYVISFFIASMLHFETIFSVVIVEQPSVLKVDGLCVSLGTEEVVNFVR